MSDFDYTISLLKDLPEQYREKGKIEGLMKAIGRQMNDIRTFYEQLKTERFITTAYGAQLDRIGDIVVLSRREAQEIMGTDEPLTDDEYRRLLIYKVELNFGDGTYRSILNCLRIIRGSTLGFTLKEELERPAMLIVESPEGPYSENVQAMLHTPIPRAGGVGLLIRSIDTKDINLKVGVVTQEYLEQSDDTELFDLDTITVLTDENSIMLSDEKDNMLIDEGCPHIPTIDWPDDEEPVEPAEDEEDGGGST